MNRNSFLKHYDFIILDLLSLIFSLLIAYLIRHNNFNSFFINEYNILLIIMLIINICIYIFYEPFKGIIRRGYLIELKKVLIQSVLSFLLVILYLFTIKDSSKYSRIVIYLTYMLDVFLTYITRIVYKKILKNKTISSLQTGDKSLLIICKESEIKKIVDTIKANNYSFYRISGICVVDKKTTKKMVCGYSIVTNIKNVLSYISTNWVDEILIATDLKTIPKNVLKGFEESRIPLKIVLNELPFESENNIIEKLGNQFILSTSSRAVSNYQIIIKRLMDIVGSIVGCLITILLIIIIGPIIYFKSPGNIFYVSDRVGKNGKVFKFYKFRSMILNADDYKNNLKKKNRVKDGMMFKVDNDPRIIPGIGNFIRKTSLDEFPQFFNVLKGDMSLVGTRPPTLDEWNRYSPYYRSRLSIKPGITGLWQVSGRSNITNFDEVVKLDNEYIDNFEIKLDIKILFATFKQLFNKNNTGAL